MIVPVRSLSIMFGMIVWSVRFDKIWCICLDFGLQIRQGWQGTGRCSIKRWSRQSVRHNQNLCHCPSLPFCLSHITYPHKQNFCCCPFLPFCFVLSTYSNQFAGLGLVILGWWAWWLSSNPYFPPHCISTHNRYRGWFPWIRLFLCRAGLQKLTYHYQYVQVT